MAWDIGKLNTVLKDELSAVETYQQAMEKIREHTLVDEKQITAICEEHRDSAAKLRERISQLGGTPPESPGIWGSWSKLVMGSAKLMGEEATLKALREGEESGVEDYQGILDESDVPADVRNLIQTTLLPRQRAHIQVLNRFIGAKAS